MALLVSVPCIFTIVTTLTRTKNVLLLDNERRASPEFLPAIRSPTS